MPIQASTLRSKFVVNALALLGVLSAGAAQAVDNSFLTIDPLFRDVVTSRAGAETIVPFMILRDNNSDGFPDVFYVEWRVFNNGTFIHKSAGKSVTFPQPVCATPSWQGYDFINKFLGGSSSRVFGAFELYAECQDSEGYKEAFKTLVFSADLASAGNAGWSYVAPRGAVGFDAVDMNGDSTNEIVLTTFYHIDPNNEAAGTNIIVRVMNPVNGSVVSEANYALVRP